MKRRRLLSLSLVLIVLAISFAVSYARRDTTPPQLYVEVPEQVPAGTSFNLTISANEPVTYLVNYGTLELREVAQNYTLSLQAKPGDVPLRISATDGADNTSVRDYVINGIPKLEPSITTQSALVPGEPFSVALDWGEGVEVTSLSMSINGERVTPFLQGSSARVLSSVPLGSPEEPFNIRASLRDGYGRESITERVITVLPYPKPVEELNLSPSTLSVVTPEGRALESSMIEAAYAKISEFQMPLWHEPFVQPLAGRGTSGFGSPRRYVAGGNVSYHNGSDIAAATGTPIVATNTGRVLVADFFPIKGGFVLIDHGAGLYSYYLHQSKIHVTAGEQVERAQMIGEVGSTGLSTGPHLHWEMRLNGVSTNPQSWVNKVFP